MRRASSVPTWSTTSSSSSAFARSPRRAGRNVAQLAIAWVLAQDRGVVALVGARTRERLSDALTALAEPLDAGTLAVLGEAFADGVVAGARYPQAGMAQLDSERRN